MVTITTFRDCDNDSAVIKKNDVIVGWDELTNTEQIDLLNSMANMYNLFKKHLKR